MCEEEFNTLPTGVTDKNIKVEESENGTVTTNNLMEGGREREKERKRERERGMEGERERESVCVCSCGVTKMSAYQLNDIHLYIHVHKQYTTLCTCTMYIMYTVHACTFMCTEVINMYIVT